ncbi:MAG: polyprenyl synthetase family protein [Brachyspira sp.]|jgi:solanesyl diphosphate synthase|nr:polyprenyl synthetase family protein [Brachyspira sp.]
MSFEKSYRKIASEVDEELHKLNKEIEISFSEKTILHTGIKEFLLAPSKRIRPVLAFLYLKACNINITDAHIKIQSIVELIHNASLIHDDVIDNGKLRRAKKTMNAVFNNRLAVISGDYILSVTLQKLTELNSIELVKIFSTVIDNMCSGEIDQHFSRFHITGLEQYIEKSYKKTGALFEASIKAALRLENLPPDNAEFAKLFGIAFQIRDDLLNVTRQDNSKENNDVAEGIYNAPVIFSGNAEHPEAGIEKTKSLLNNYIDRTKQKLLKLDNNRYKSAIIELLDILKNE